MNVEGFDHLSKKPRVGSIEEAENGDRAVEQPQHQQLEVVVTAQLKGQEILKRREALLEGTHRGSNARAHGKA